MDDQKKPVDLQRFHRPQMSRWTIVKMLGFLIILGVLLGILYYLFQKIQQAENLPKTTEPKEIQRIQIDTTGFRN